MRILLDESLPQRLTGVFPDDEVVTVQQMGWSGLSNGALMAAAAAADFDALLTPDQGFEHQQNPEALPLTVVVLRARSTRFGDLAPLIPSVRMRLQNAEAKTLIVVRSK